jgi:hypothetical protein
VAGSIRLRGAIHVEARRSKERHWRCAACRQGAPDSCSDTTDDQARHCSRENHSDPGKDADGVDQCIRERCAATDDRTAHPGGGNGQTRSSAGRVGVDRREVPRRDGKQLVVVPLLDKAHNGEARCSQSFV